MKWGDAFNIVCFAIFLFFLYFVALWSLSQVFS